MDSLISQTNTLTVTFQQLWLEIVSFFPQLLTAVLLFFVGRFILRMIQKVLTKALIAVGTDEAAAKTGITETLQGVNITKPISSILSSLLYYIAMLVLIIVVFEIIGLAAVTTALVDLLSLLPNIIAGSIIIGLGLFMAQSVSKAVQTATEAAGITYGRTIGKLAAGIVVLFAALIGLTQMGIDTALLTTTVTLVMGSMALAAAIAGGLGGKTVTANVLAVKYLQDVLAEGDNIIIDGVSGTVTSLSGAGVLVQQGDKESFYSAEALFEKGFQK